MILAISGAGKRRPDLSLRPSKMPKPGQKGKAERKGLFGRQNPFFPTLPFPPFPLFLFFFSSFKKKKKKSECKDLKIGNIFHITQF